MLYAFQLRGVLEPHHFNLSASRACHIEVLSCHCGQSARDYPEHSITTTTLTIKFVPVIAANLHGTYPELSVNTLSTPKGLSTSANAAICNLTLYETQRKDTHSRRSVCSKRYCEVRSSHCGQSARDHPEHSITITTPSLKKSLHLAHSEVSNNDREQFKRSRFANLKRSSYNAQIKLGVPLQLVLRSPSTSSEQRGVQL